MVGTNSSVEENLPATVGEAVDWIIRHMPDSDIAMVRKMSSTGLMFFFHFSTGLAIRNGLLLNGENKALIRDCLKQKYGGPESGSDYLFYHLDDLSTFLLEKVWERLHAENPAPGPQTRAESGT